MGGKDKKSGYATYHFPLLQEPSSITSVLKIGSDQLVRPVKLGIGPFSSPIVCKQSDVKKSVNNRKNWSKTSESPKPMVVHTVGGLKKKFFFCFHGGDATLHHRHRH